MSNAAHFDHLQNCLSPHGRGVRLLVLKWTIQGERTFVELNFYTINRSFIIPRKQSRCSTNLNSFSRCFTSEPALLLLFSILGRYVNHGSRARPMTSWGDVNVIKQRRGPLSGLVGCAHASRVLIEGKRPPDLKLHSRMAL